MKAASVALAAVWILRMCAGAIEVRDCHSLDGMLEEPPGVKVVASLGFVPSPESENPERYTVEDAAVAPSVSQTACLTLEAEGPRTLRLHHWIGWPDTAGFAQLRLDGRTVREFSGPGAPTTDVTIPGGKHSVEFITYVTPAALYKVVDVAPGLAALTMPDLVLPAPDAISVRLPVISDSPVTWAAAGLPEGLTLDAATGVLHGSLPEIILSNEPAIVWLTLTNASGSQVEQLLIWRVGSWKEISPELPLAGRRARAAGTGAFLLLRSEYPDGVNEPEPHLIRSWQYQPYDEPAELVTLVQGPDRVSFRSRGSQTPGPVIARIDGAEVLREFARTTAWDEFSVEVPAGTHELTWELPMGGMLDRVRLESSAGPRLAGPFTLTAVPGAAFSHRIGVASGPATYHSASLPPGLALSEETGVLSGSLPAGDYGFTVEARAAGGTDRAVYRLQIRDDAAAVLGTPGLTWLQGEGKRPWTAATTGPGNSSVWQFPPVTGGWEMSRIETVIHGPDAIACRFQPLGYGALVIELDGTRHAAPFTTKGYENFLTVPVPHGRHVLTLLAVKAGEFSLAGGVELQPLLSAGAGAPVVSIPPVIYTDGTEVRVPFSIAGGPAESVTAGDFPDGLAISGQEVTGRMGAGENFVWSLLSATRSGRTASARVEWWRTDINVPLDSAGWYGFANGAIPASLEVTTVSWDGISAVGLRSPRYGTHETGVARIFTGPETLTFRRSSNGAVRLEVKVDGVPVHVELVNGPEWQQVAVPIPAGEHHVVVSARPEHLGDWPGVPETDYSTFPHLLLDDFRSGGDYRPAIDDASRDIRVRPGEGFTFRPQADGRVRVWTLTDLPDSCSFDPLTGTIRSPSVTLPSGEYAMILTAQNLSGRDSVRLTLTVTSPLAHGDSPRLFFKNEGWSLEPNYGGPVMSVDGGDVHYSNYNGFGRMSVWVDGPDVLSYWWQFLAERDSTFLVKVDGAVVANERPEDDWRRNEIDIPAGRHLVEFDAYSTVVVDHIRLASDGIPVPQTEPVYCVAPAGFSLPLTATNAPQSWQSTQYAISDAGVLSGALEDPEPQVVRVSATNAAGTGHALIGIRPQSDFNVVLDSSLPLESEVEYWWPEAPGAGVEPVPADGEDYARSGGAAGGALRVTVPPGGGLLSFWAKSHASFQQIEVSANNGVVWSPTYFAFNLTDTAWHRILVPTPAAGARVQITDQSPPDEKALWLDRVEFVRPGDPLIDLCPLPDLRAGTAYSADLKLIAGGEVTWQVSGLPPGLTVDSGTGRITGMLPANIPAAEYPLRVTATTAAGKSTFALLILSAQPNLDAALDTHTLVWRSTRRAPSSGWQPGSVAGAAANHGNHPPHDGYDLISCAVGDGGMARLETEVDGPGTLSFWWGGSTYDVPRFFVNGVLRGEAVWNVPPALRHYSITLPPGRHTLAWLVENPDGSDDGVGFLDRVLWSGDAAPLFTCESFTIEAAPGSAVEWSIPTNGAPQFSGSGLPDGFSLDSLTGTLRGIVPPQEGANGFTVRITQDGREDIARFRLLVRRTAAEALETAGATWLRAEDSHWRVIDDPARGDVFCFSAASTGISFSVEDLHLLVDAPCLVSSWVKVESASGAGAGLYVRADDLAPAAEYARSEPSNWHRTLIAVPGQGRRKVSFQAYSNSSPDAVYLDAVKVFPWNADVNSDGLSNSMACALGRWPDDVSTGDPPVTLTDHPTIPGVRSLCFGDPATDPATALTRQHAIRLQLDGSSGLTSWTPSGAAEESNPACLRRWRLPATAGLREFYRVEALPMTRE